MAAGGQAARQGGLAARKVAEKRAVVPAAPAGTLSSITDPRALGCRCDECPLGQYHRACGTFKPVLPEFHANDRGVIIGDFPGADEVARGRPQVGRSGEELQDGLDAVGLRRDEYVIDNTLLCWPPLNDIKAFMGQWRRDNRKRKAKGEAPLISPYEACRPHLLRQIERTPDVITLGAVPTSMVLGRAKSIRKVRGAFIEGYYAGDKERPKVLRKEEPGEAPPEGVWARFRLTPTLSPAFVLRAPAWRIVFQRDLQRAQRWRDDQLEWTPPVITRNPTAEVLTQFLSDPAIPVYSVDIETPKGGQHVTLIGFGAPDGRVMTVRFRSVEDSRQHILSPDNPVYPEGNLEGWRVLVAIWRFLVDGSRQKVGHNINYFDKEVLLRAPELIAVARACMGVHPPAPPPEWEIRGVFDTIVGFRAWFSELTRDLYTLGTLTTDVPDWKAAADERKIAVDPRTDKELEDYNAIDCKVNVIAADRVWQGVVSRGQQRVVVTDQGVQEVAREMSVIGIRVNQEGRAQLEEEWRDKAKAELKVLREIAGPAFNPRSTAHWIRLIGDQWGLPLIATTETGDPQVDDVALKTMLVTKGFLNAEQERAIKAGRAFRTADKILGTYLLPWRRFDDLRKNSEGQLVGGICRADGRLHPRYNTTTPKTGRISSSGPNAQNVQKFLRKLWIPEDGNIFVGADYDQIELRLFCAVAGIESYLKVFEGGGDPHSATALLLYGDVFKKAMQESMTPAQWERFVTTGVAVKAKSPTLRYNDLRTFAKTFVYAVLYGGSAKTVFDSVSRAENEETGELLFPDMTLGQVTAAYNAFMRNAPEVAKFWEQLLGSADRYGFVTEPVLGRRRDFPGGAGVGDARNEILNFPIQGGAAAIMAEGLLRLRQRVKPDFERRRGIILQCHDAAYLECAEEEADAVCQHTEEALTARYAHIQKMVFSTEAGKARTIKDAA